LAGFTAFRLYIDALFFVVVIDQRYAATRKECAEISRKLVGE